MNPGEHIGKRYRIERLLGEGGMGRVYLAYDETLEKQVALKTLLPALVSDRRAVAQLKREVRTAQELRHPNICATYDFQETGEQPFIVMEYVQGETLTNFIYDQPGHRCSAEQFASLSRQIMGAVGAAHQAGVVHRDLKSLNVMVTADGTIRIMDFGIAAMLKETYSRSTGASISLSIHYASPEQIRGEAPTVMMDVYSMGCIFYEMLTGSPPFTRGDILYQQLSVAPSAMEGVPPAVAAMVMGFLEKESGKRLRIADFEGGQDARTVKVAAAGPVRTAPPDPSKDRVSAPAVESAPVAGSAGRKPMGAPYILLAGAAFMVVFGLWIWSSVPPPKPKVAGDGRELRDGIAKVAGDGRKLRDGIAKVAGDGRKLRDGIAKVAGDGREWRDGIVQRWVPGGEYQMGCSPGDNECFGDEKPSRRVRINGFWMQESEVTQDAYERVMGENRSRFKGSQLPVESVTWYEAKSYCAKAGLRLPTEEEWEYAARGGTTGSRYGELNEVAWHDGNSGKRTHEVKGKTANRYGLYDMLGNVWEWTASDHDAETKTLRGGSWYYIPLFTRASNRYRFVPVIRNINVGFRCLGD